jgi:hypothetical protein
MAGLRQLVRRVAGLPVRAKAALAAAAVLSVVAVLLVLVPGGGDDEAPADETSTDEALPPAEGDGGMPTTTVRTGGIDVDAPDGWQVIPLPEVGFGIAVPPEWEAVALSPDGLATLAGASPVVPDFAESAHAAAAEGGLVYAAGEDAAGGVSDVMVRAAPQTGVTDLTELEDYAEALASQAGRTDPEVDTVDDADAPTVQLRFEVGSGDERAVGTETLVLDDGGIVWSVIVTSDDPAIQDDLATAITGTLTFADR